MATVGRSDRREVAQARAYQLAAGTSMSTRQIVAHLKSEGTPLRRQSVTDITREVRYSARQTETSAILRRAASTPTKYLRRGVTRMEAQPLPFRPSAKPPAATMKRRAGENSKQFAARKADAMKAWRADWQRFRVGSQFLAGYTQVWAARQELLRRSGQTTDKSYNDFRDRAIKRHE